jgi:hypothetical protein
MRRMGLGYSPNYTTGYQQAGFFDGVGDFFGNLGNSWQGGEDQAMYGGNTQGQPYATYEGVTNSAPVQAGQAVGAAAGNLVANVEGFFTGLARGGGVVLGVAIIVIALANEHHGRHG